MIRRVVGASVAAFVATVGAACAPRDAASLDRAAPEAAAAAQADSTAPTEAPETTTTTAAPSVWRAVPTSGEVKAIVTSSGIVLARNPDGNVVTACSATARIAGDPVHGANVVIDPGHGGVESGTVAASGLTEKDLNLRVALEVKRILERLGAVVVLTRTGDYRITVASRAAIAARLAPQALVSIHHNAGGLPAVSGSPGTETYYQRESVESKRLGGLLYEEVVAAFSRHDIAWAGTGSAGAKYRTNTSGEDFYGILRRSAPVPAVIVEAAYLSNPPEAELAATPSFQRMEAQAIVDALIRFVTTNDPGSGFVTPRARTDIPKGGGPQGCVEPAY